MQSTIVTADRSIALLGEIECRAGVPCLAVRPATLCGEYRVRVSLARYVRLPACFVRARRGV